MRRYLAYAFVCVFFFGGQVDLLYGQAGAQDASASSAGRPLEPNENTAPSRVTFSPKGDSPAFVIEIKEAEKSSNVYHEKLSAVSREHNVSYLGGDVTHFIYFFALPDKTEKEISDVKTSLLKLMPHSVVHQTTTDKMNDVFFQIVGK